MVLADKIVCNGIKPSKSEVYLLAAELVELEHIKDFKAAIIEAFKSFDYDYHDYYYDYYDYEYHDYYYDYHHDYFSEYYDYYHHDYSEQEKVIYLLLLSAMYAPE